MTRNSSNSVPSIARHFAQYSALIGAIFLSGCGPSRPSASPGAAEDAASVAAAPQTHSVGHGWSIDVPGTFRQKTEDGAVILYRPGTTVYTLVWNNDKDQTPSERLAWIKEHVSPDAFESQEVEDGGLVRFAYRLTENRDKGVVHALYGYAVGPRGTPANGGLFRPSLADRRGAEDLA